MSRAPSARPAPTRAIIGAIACVSVFALTMGLTYPLLTFVLDAAGHSETAIGINAAMTPLGVLAASPFYPKLIGRGGGWRVALGCLLAAAALIAAMASTRDYASLLALRFLLGAAGCGVFIVSETWINQLATRRARGRVIGLYATAFSTGFAAGPLILSVVGIEGAAPFFIGSGVCLIAALVVVSVRRRAPNGTDEPAASAWSFATLAPPLLLAVAIFALWDSALLALFPLFGGGFGLETRFIAIALAVCILGNTALQIPIGWIADRASRRDVMIGCAAVAALSAAALPVVIGAPALFLFALFIWGAAAGGVYTMAMTELGDRFSGAELVAGNAAFSVAFGFGGVVGGPATGAAMQLFGPSAFAWSLALAFAAVAARAFLSRRAT